MTRKSEGKYVSVAIIFIVVVVLLVGITFLWKFITNISKSSFDGKHQYIIAATQDNLSPEFVILDPAQEKITLLTVTHESDTSLAAKILTIPVDATITGLTLAPSSVSTFARNLLFNTQIQHMTFLDKLRFWWFVRQVKPTNIKNVTIDTQTDPTSLSTQLPMVLLDTQLYQEAKTVVIINASDEIGVGTNVGKIFSNIGGNVIAIQTADTPQAKSSITYLGKESYTLTRLQRMLGVTAHLAQTTAPQIADITVVIGKDKSNSF